MEIIPITIWREANGEGYFGMMAVYHVIQNRARHNKIWPIDLEKVCLQPYQFSCWNTSDPNRKHYPTSEEINVIKGLISNSTQDTTFGATYYCNPAIVTDPFAGRDTYEFTVKIGHHLFYKDSPPVVKH